jgi:hypothetical protein
MGRTIYAFTEGAPFLLLCLIWTLSTVWTGVLLFFSSHVAVIFLIPALLFCAGLWLAYSCGQAKGKRRGLVLASGSLLTILTLLALYFAAMCLTSMYGIFLSTTDRESYDTLFSYFRLVGALFVLMLAGILFLNQLRRVLRTAQGVLRGNRGMADCPLSAGLFSLVFAGLALYLAFATERMNSALTLLQHALTRLPNPFSLLADPLAAADWTWLAPSLIGGAVALAATGVVLIMYWQVLRLSKAEILRKGGHTKKKKKAKSATPSQEQVAETQ